LDYSPETIVTLTSDMAKLLAAVHELKLKGTIWFSTALSIAQLVLKHRANKNQKQRVIEEATLVKLAKKLKKNNVAVDIVNFGQFEENMVKLEAFIEALGGEESRCHLITVPSGPTLLSDALGQSPIFIDEEGQSQYIPRSDGFDMGVDPNLDPELALALRLSLEEERARQDALLKQQQEAEEVSGATSTAQEEEKEPSTMEGYDDAMLAKAIAMSLEPPSHDTPMEDVSSSKKEEDHPPQDS
jgi:26S proteasome regulatory subunit N10